MKYRLQLASGVAALIAAAALSIAPRMLRAQDASPAPPPPPAAPAGPATVRVFDFQGGAFLGVDLKDVNIGDVSSMKLPGEYGAIVAHVEPDSPAAKAGIEENDVILEYGGMRVWSASQLSQLVRETPVGRNVTVRVSRSGKTMTLHAAIASRRPPRVFSYSSPDFHMPNFNFNFNIPRYRLGVEVESLTPQLAAYFGVKQDKGVLVTEVESDSPAAKAGLKAGDCIVQVGTTEISSVSGLRSALDGASKPEINLSIVRAGQEKSLSATLESAPSPVRDMQGREMRREIQRQARDLRREIPRYQEQVRRLQRQMYQTDTGDV